jgi:hypothetical protein
MAGMRPLGALVACVALFALPGCAGGEAPTKSKAGRPEALLGVISGDRNELSRLDPLSLQPLPGRRVVLGPGPWDLSPDRSRLAVSRVTSLRLVDLARTRVVGDVSIGEGQIEALAWLGPRRLIVSLASELELAPNEEARRELAVVDPESGRILSRRRVAGTLERWATARDALVFLLGAPGRIGPTRLGVFDATGDLRLVSLSRIRAGWVREEVGGERSIDRRREPGLAIDPEGGRALVVDPAGLVAEVDLARLDVAYHPVRERVSLLGRLRNWLEPVARADGGGGFDGAVRTALWAGDGLLAVSGWDDYAVANGQGTVEVRSTPAGLRLVDTREWTIRTLDEGASRVTLADGLLLAYGSLWDGSAWRGIGLRAHSSDGERRFQLFDEEPIFTVQAAEGYAYPQLENSCRGWVVDLRTGRSLAELDFNPDFGSSSFCEWPSLLEQ